MKYLHNHTAKIWLTRNNYLIYSIFIFSFFSIIICIIILNNFKNIIFYIILIILNIINLNLIFFKKYFKTEYKYIKHFYIAKEYKYIYNYINLQLNIIKELRDKPYILINYIIKQFEKLEKYTSLILIKSLKEIKKKYNNIDLSFNQKI